VTSLPSKHGKSPYPQTGKRLRPKTYSVAVYLVFAVAILQVVMVILAIWLRSMVVTVNTKLPPSVGALKPSPTYHPVENPSSRPGGAGPDFPALPSLATSPHTGLLQVPGSSDELARVDTLNEEAQVFLKQNEYQSALDLLIRAEDIDPRHPDTLRNIAETYNLINKPVESKIYWQRLVDLGPAVGTVYAVAKDHVVLADAGTGADPLQEASTLPREIYVDSVEKTPVETKNGDAQFHVRAVLRKQDGLLPKFEQQKLQPYVIFYQQMPDGTLVPDLGQRKGAFDDTFLFWSGKTSEPFGVDYIMPVPGIPGPNGSPQGKYYGFVIGLYYDKILQDVRSEPSDLCSRMALPQEIE
jgi:hypothetical protein